MKETENWDKDIQDLELFFNDYKHNGGDIVFGGCQTIVNPTKFIDSHLGFVRANNGNKLYLPYLNRLKEFKLAVEGK